MNKLTTMFGSLGRRSSSISTNASGDRKNLSQELDKCEFTTILFKPIHRSYSQAKIYRPMIRKITVSKKDDPCEEEGVLLSKKHHSGVDDDTVSEQWEKGYKDDSGSRDDIPTVADITTTMTPTSDDWYLFLRVPQQTVCLLDSLWVQRRRVIDFLARGEVSGGLEALVSRLSAKTDAYFLKPEDNPFAARL
ncbi:hypothetical protein HID58_056742 [Brassica napus]|uniref:Uncharacterized protein n=1 Tax=Brassica napus TaxID=3708 RepID=A0ABQ8APF6_BRANA|nr:hypothetical protein HID58_056742 [Brassica napus]